MEADWDSRVPNYKCDVCGLPFYVRPYSLYKQKTHCCSITCSNKLRSARMRGEGNHQYGLTGELNSSFKSDWNITIYGYLEVRCTTHPFRRYNNFMLAHRLVVEEYLKKEDPGSEYLIEIDGQLVLDPNTVVHHKDGNRLNNLISNLEIMTLGDHAAMHNMGMSYERNYDGSFKSITYKKRGVGKLHRKHILDAGQDIYSIEDKWIHPTQCEKVSTGLQIEIPEGYAGLVWSRSGLSVKHNIEVGAGCIDCGYVGELKVVLYNHSDTPYLVHSGDAIAQLLVVPISLRDFENTEETVESTERGEGAFGSTGV